MSPQHVHHKAHHKVLSPKPALSCVADPDVFLSLQKHVRFPSTHSRIISFTEGLLPQVKDSCKWHITLFHFLDWYICQYLLQLTCNIYKHRQKRDSYLLFCLALQTLVHSCLMEKTWMTNCWRRRQAGPRPMARHIFLKGKEEWCCFFNRHSYGHADQSPLKTSGTWWLKKISTQNILGCLKHHKGSNLYHTEVNSKIQIAMKCSFIPKWGQSRYQGNDHKRGFQTFLGNSSHINSTAAEHQLNCHGTLVLCRASWNMFYRTSIQLIPFHFLHASQCQPWSFGLILTDNSTCCPEIAREAVQSFP